MKNQVHVRALNCFSHISYGIKDAGQEFFIDEVDLEHLIESENVEVVVKKALRVPVLDDPVPFAPTNTEATPPSLPPQDQASEPQTLRRRGRQPKQ